MVKATLFCNPKNKECIEITNLLTEKNLTFIMRDATSKEVSMHLYHDMRIDVLPAVYLYRNNKYTLYQGLERIIAALSKI